MAQDIFSDNNSTDANQTTFHQLSQYNFFLFCFIGEGGSWSALGSEAEGVTVDKPTMVLSFHDKKDDHQIRATIVHEFGHVLGLGHEHQHPSYWKVIKDFVNTESMRKSLKLNRNDFNMQWVNTTLRSSNTPYDEDSVMHYPYVTHICTLCIEC